MPPVQLPTGGGARSFVGKHEFGWLAQVESDFVEENESTSHHI